MAKKESKGSRKEVEAGEAYACKACGSKAVTSLVKLPSVAYAGWLNDARYTAVERERVSCDGCGQLAVHTRYVYDPKEWTE